MAKINYVNKVPLSTNPSVADINKIKADDMNEIKRVVNENDDNVGDLSQLPTPNKDNIVNAIKGIMTNGSNSNGEYIKFYDGTLVCFMTINETVDITISWGSVYIGKITKTYTFPLAFTTAPRVFRDLKGLNNSSVYEVDYDSPVITNTTIKNFGAARGTSSEGVKVKIDVVAIGRWK